MDPATRQMLDSLNHRITQLEKEIPRLAQTRSPQYFFQKQELDFTLFLSYYERYRFDEDLDEAANLVETRLLAAQKRKDETAINYYQPYRTEIAKEFVINSYSIHYTKLYESKIQAGCLSDEFCSYCETCCWINKPAVNYLPE